MMEEYGYPKNKVIPARPVRFLKQKEIIIWRGDTLHLETLFQEMWLRAPLKKDVMRDMALVLQSKRYTWIIQMQ